MQQNGEYTERFVENQHDLNYGDTSAVLHGALLSQF